MAEREVTLAPPSAKPETDSCVTCGSISNLKQCAKCLSVAYCCKEHQIQDWKKHKKNCKKIIQNGEQNSETKPQTNSTPAAETDHPESNSDQSATINLSFEFDKRPYKSRAYPQPAGRDLISLAQHVTSQLKSSNFCVVDSIFNPTLANAVLKEVIKLHSSGIFMDGQLSGGRRNSDTIVTKKTIRGDEITWLEGNEKEFPYICMLVKTLDRLLSKMNVYLKGECDVGGRTKAMVACYPGNGTGYACHVDNPNRDGRCITCLFYLNEGWDVKVNGGLLRLFRGTDDYVDVEPILNRAIFFWSDRRNPHEVQPAFKTRYAITVWYLDKHEREEARKAANLQASEDVSKIQQQYSMMNLNNKQSGKEESDGQKKEDVS